MRRLIRSCEERGRARVYLGDDGILGVGAPLRPPVECHPLNLVGNLSYEDGTVEAISPGGFGTITRLLVDDGDTVSPGEPILEFVERRPTLEEWREQYEMTERLRARIDELQAHFERGPWHAWWITLRRKYRNTDKPIPVWGNNPEFMRRLRAGEIRFETVGQAENSTPGKK